MEKIKKNTVYASLFFLLAGCGKTPIDQLIGKWGFVSNKTGFDEIPIFECTIYFEENRTYEQQCIGTATKNNVGTKVSFTVNGKWDFNENTKNESFYLLKPQTVSSEILAQTNARQEDLESFKKSEKVVAMPPSAQVLFSIKNTQRNGITINVISSTEHEYGIGGVDLRRVSKNN